MKKSKQAMIAGSFLELAGEKPINKITIADITGNCGMSQPTFYRYFKDKYDMIAWIYARMAGENIGKIGKDGYRWADTLLDGMRQHARNRQYMINALKHTSGRDSFLAQMAAMNIEFIEDEIRRKQGAQAISEEMDAMVRMYCYGTNQYLYDWLMSGSALSCETVAGLMEASIPEALRPYLCT